MFQKCQASPPDITEHENVLNDLFGRNMQEKCGDVLFTLGVFKETCGLGGGGNKKLYLKEGTQSAIAIWSEWMYRGGQKFKSEK